MYPNTYTTPGLFSALRNIKWGALLDGTQKTLGVINQAIPVIYQVKPVVSNVRSMFKIANAINTPERVNTEPIKEVSKEVITNKPIFYI